MSVIFLTCILTFAQAGDERPSPPPPPLTEEQLVRLRTLVKEVQTRDAELKSALQDRQQALARLYAQFELDPMAAEKLQREVLDLQTDLLTNYHRLQVELRAIVGAARFAALKRRIDASLNGGGTPAKEK